MIRDLGTTTTAGFLFTPIVPFAGFPLFCTTGPACTLVSGSPYDPVTGKLNAVGSDLLDHPDATATFFSSAGDLRISEVPEPGTFLLVGCGLIALAAVRRG